MTMDEFTQEPRQVDTFAGYNYGINDITKHTKYNILCL